MSVDDIGDFLSRRLDPSDDSCKLDLILYRVIRDELATSSPIPSEAIDSQCTLAHIGDILVSGLRMLSRLSNRLVEGEIIEEYSKQKLYDMEEESDFSDTRFMVYMSNKHASLRSINASLQRTSGHVGKLWAESQETPEVPSPIDKENQNGTSRVAQKPVKNTADSARIPLTLLTHPSTSHHSNPQFLRTIEFQKLRSPKLEDSVQGDLNEAITNLSTRGKGHYTCPLGLDCLKGGKSNDGELVIFERNSAFRAHLEKHQKRYICELGGCKNKEGFARKDQLQRHQRDTRMHDGQGITST